MNPEKRREETKYLEGSRQSYNGDRTKNQKASAVFISSVTLVTDLPSLLQGQTLYSLQTEGL